MHRTHRRALLCSVALLAAASGVVPPSAHATTVDASPVDCAGPAPDAQPGTNEWTIRDRQNMYCALERLADAAQHPAGGFGSSPSTETRDAIPFDEYTVPQRHAGKRFRFLPAEVTNRAGLQVPIELYRPCAVGTCTMPTSLAPQAGPYPVVVVVPGGFQGLGPGAPKELYRWAAQGLAEAGYLTVVLDIMSAHY
jgi:hypothetical protein